MVLGFGTSLGWMIYGSLGGRLEDPAFLQPMYPGLAVAVIVYVAGWVLTGRKLASGSLNPVS